MIRVVQILCPLRHCTMAVVYNSPTGEPEPDKAKALEEQVHNMQAAGVLNPWCGICRSRELRAEDQPTKYQTMEEAKPAFERLAKVQAKTREYFRRVRMQARNQ